MLSFLSSLFKVKFNHDEQAVLIEAQLTKDKQVLEKEEDIETPLVYGGETHMLLSLFLLQPTCHPLPCRFFYLYIATIFIPSTAF